MGGGWRPTGCGLALGFGGVVVRGFRTLPALLGL